MAKSHMFCDKFKVFLTIYVFLHFCLTLLPISLSCVGFLFLNLLKLESDVFSHLSLPTGGSLFSAESFLPGFSCLALRLAVGRIW